MKEKEEIRKKPWKIYITTQIHYSTLKNPVSYIEIELTNEENNLFLLKEDFGKGKAKLKKLRSAQKYDENGSNFFSELVPSFGKVWVFIVAENKPRPFDSYEKFLDIITSD